MKTPEEIRLAVLKECERLCKKPETGGEIGKKMSIYRPSSDLWIIETERWTGQNDVICSVSVDIPEHDDNWELAYRLLNIEARELGEKYNALLKLSNQIQEKADALEERAQGLVDAIESALGCDTNNDEYGEKHESMRETLREALNQWKGGGK